MIEQQRVHHHTDPAQHRAELLDGTRPGLRELAQYSAQQVTDKAMTGLIDSAAWTGHGSHAGTVDVQLPGTAASGTRMGVLGRRPAGVWGLRVRRACLAGLTSGAPITIPSADVVAPLRPGRETSLQVSLRNILRNTIRIVGEAGCT